MAQNLNEVKQNKKRSRTMRNKTGFTILEVLIVIVIMGVMMGIGFNYIMGWLPSYRIRQAVRDVHSNLQLARMEAIKKHVNCAVSFTKTGNVINGYVIYMDLDNDRQRDAGERLLRTVLLTEYEGDVSFDTNQTGSNPPATGDGVTFPVNAIGQPTVSFRTNGLPLQGGGAGLGNGTVYLINTKNVTKRIVVNQVGRIQIQ